MTIIATTCRRCGVEFEPGREAIIAGVSARIAAVFPHRVQWSARSAIACSSPAVIVGHVPGGAGDDGKCLADG
jgi:hypothetical protein